MKKCLLSILLATVLLCACAQQTDNTLQTPESSTLVELTVATEETVIETPAPLATESPAPAPTQTPEPTATPAPTEIPISEPTAAPTEAPATEPVAAESQPAQVSMSYGAVPFDLAAGSEEWWSIDSSDSVYWAVQENINAMRAAAGLSPLTMDSGLSAAADNFLAAVMFQQCFQILVHTADNREDHCLPRHVRFLLDEFPNIGMIPDFQILISTIRSRNIGCTLIYQSIAQLKSQYGDDWGTILENCDSELVLGGGNNPESLEFFGKQLGKRTIEVLNTTENLGAQGSFSKNYQVASRDLMTPEEIRTMPRNRCLLMISGVVPFYSYKFDLKKHPNYALVEKEGHRPFDYERRAENNFAAFMKNVQEINNIELDDDESDT